MSQFRATYSVVKQEEGTPQNRDTCSFQTEGMRLNNLITT